MILPSLEGIPGPGWRYPPIQNQILEVAWFPHAKSLWFRLVWYFCTEDVRVAHLRPSLHVWVPVQGKNYLP